MRKTKIEISELSLDYKIRTISCEEIDRWFNNHFESSIKQKITEDILNLNTKKIIEDKIESILFHCQAEHKDRMYALEIRLDNLAKNMDYLVNEINALKRKE